MKKIKLKGRIFHSANLKKLLLKIAPLLFVLFSLQATAQDAKITGRVTDTSGNGVSGASVTVKGSTTGVATDATGNFTITAGTNATLTISALGYSSRDVVVGGRTSVEVSLTTAAGQSLDQVVVVGYGAVRRRDLTGSVASVSGSELAKQPVLTPTQALQGKVSGVQIITSGAPNALPTVRVRGTGTMLGGANPLYVVDGVITDDIRNINNADIVSLDILKDASSTAIYGMRAANGVLLITTKKGRVGKMIVAYDAQAGFREASHVVKMAGAQEYANYLNEASITYNNQDSLVRASRLAAGYNTNWFDAILRRGFQQNHNISISGGSDKINYFFSAGYLTDDGIQVNNNLKRFTLRSNNEYKFTSKLRLTALVSYSRSDLNDANYGAFTNAYRSAPTVASKVGNLYGNTSEAGNVGNPLLDIEKNYNQGIDNRVQGTFALEYKPVNWVTLRSSMGIDLDFYRNQAYGYQYFSNAATFITLGGNQAQGRSQLGIASNTASRWVWDNTATFAKTFDKHALTLLVGTTSEAYRFSGVSGTSKDVPVNKDQWFLNAGTENTVSNTGDKFTRSSYLARLNYTFDNRYLLTASIRDDGTSRFGPNYRRDQFASAALGWNITNEGFMQNQKLFSNLKLRASYGQVGNDQIPTSLYYTLAAVNLPYYFSGNRFLGVSFDNLTDPDVHWEKTDEYDLGLDYGLLRNRLTGEIDFYHKKTKDALIYVNIPAILGDADNKYLTNAASFQNVGVEFSVNWADKINKNWSYSIGGNMAFNKNKITGLNGGQALLDGGIGGNQGFVTKSDNNQPIGSFYVLKAIGIIQNAADSAASGYGGSRIGDLKYQDVNGDKVIDDQDRQYMGSYLPKITYGVNGSLSYKTFDLSLNVYGTQGSKIYNGKKAIRGSDPRDNIEAGVARDHWTPNNRNTGVPRATTSQLPASSYYIESGAFVRLNNLTIGYNIPVKNMKLVKFTNLRIYATGQNLITITPYSGFTPELLGFNPADPASRSTPLNGGIELNSYPTTRTFAFGVNLSF